MYTANKNLTRNESLDGVAEMANATETQAGGLHPDLSPKWLRKLTREQLYAVRLCQAVTDLHHGQTTPVAKLHLLHTPVISTSLGPLTEK